MWVSGQVTHPGRPAAGKRAARWQPEQRSGSSRAGNAAADRRAGDRRAVAGRSWTHAGERWGRWVQSTSSQDVGRYWGELARHPVTSTWSDVTFYGAPLSAVRDRDSVENGQRPRGLWTKGYGPTDQQGDNGGNRKPDSGDALGAEAAGILSPG